MAYTWDRNIWTGDDIARVSRSIRLIRIGTSTDGYLYRGEDWGDFSLRYPIKGAWMSTPKGALRALQDLDDERG